MQQLNTGAFERGIIYFDDYQGNAVAVQALCVSTVCCRFQVQLYHFTGLALSGTLYSTESLDSPAQTYSLPCPGCPSDLNCLCSLFSSSPLPETTALPSLPQSPWPGSTPSNMPQFHQSGQPPFSGTPQALHSEGVWLQLRTVLGAVPADNPPQALYLG